MAGKKKKSLANKLAKMSDEERARYLQHRAEVEEEAKKRKEQLIATFMKKKIKKEEAFARLNLAKINQNWHQILRKTKCKYMREEVEHMKKWIERALAYKNRTIEKLLEELEESEDQYLNNFQYHSTHIDNIIEHQNEYVEKLQKQYDEDILSLMEKSRREEEELFKNAGSARDYLKTIIFGFETITKKASKESYEYYMKKVYETEHNNRDKIMAMQKQLNETLTAIWRDILSTVRLYIERTDTRRLHYCELRRLDAESAAEIRENEETIKREEELIATLTNEYDHLLKTRDEKIKSLNTEIKDLNGKFIKLKKQLHVEMQHDEKKLRILSSTSSESLEYFSKVSQKGEHILNLANTCAKFETDREKITKWIPFVGLECKIEAGDGLKSDKEFVLTDDEKIIQKEKVFVNLREIGEPSTLNTNQTPEHEILQAPIIHIAHTSFKKKSNESSKSPSDTFDKHSLKESMLNEDKSNTKQENASRTVSKSSTTKKSILDICYENLKKLENFWYVYNKVEVDYMEIKEEKRILARENKQLRGMIRAVLEAAALDKSIPNSKVSTRVPSQARGTKSAPLRRTVFT